jgi:chromosome segregation ATPase
MTADSDVLAAQLESANKSRDVLSLALATEKGRREELDKELDRWRQERDTWRLEGEKWRQEAEQSKMNMNQAIKVSRCSLSSNLLKSRLGVA